MQSSPMFALRMHLILQAQGDGAPEPVVRFYAAWVDLWSMGYGAALVGMTEYARVLLLVPKAPAALVGA